VKYILPISKKEAKYLEFLGFRYSDHKNYYEADLCHSANKRHRKYYAAPKVAVIRALKAIRGE